MMTKDEGMTTKDEVLTLEEATEGVKRLRWAIHPFGGPPTAQRRWLQMGLMKRSSESLEVEAGRVDAYVAAGAATDDEARLVAEVLEAFRALKTRRANLFYDEEEYAPRAFLWSAAFEESEWTDLRAKARQAFGVLSEGRGPLIEAG